MTTMLLAGAVLVAGLVAVPASPAGAVVTAPTASKKEIRKKGAKPFFRMCHRTHKFGERQFNYTVDAVFAARCVARRTKGVKLISSYPGHLPSANKAIDIMVNLKGSCRSGRRNGNDIARYLMRHARQHNIQYIIWKNSYWPATSRPTKFRNWRHGMSGGDCTTRHYDHVHVSFR
jgi:hypothetical protein